jgi:dihydroorotate dehydrogenase (NAD+) catalytic subunit
MAKFDLALATSFMNAAGSLGFAPASDCPELARLGAFITNPISLRPRAPTRSPLALPFPGGFLLHTGFPNPGLRAVLRRYAAQWARLEIPVIVHFLCDQPGDLPAVFAQLENIPGVMGVELGLPPSADTSAVLAFAQAASSEMPVLLRFPLDQATSLAAAIAGQQDRLEISAISVGPPRGLLPWRERLVHGRLYGPAIFPLALNAVKSLLEQGFPVIGGGGIYSLEQAEAMIAAGALAVQLDSVLWRGYLPEK